MFNKTEYLNLLGEFKAFTTEIEGPGNGFACDGPISIDLWETTSPKIAFLAKETYGHLGCDICKVIGEPESWNAAKFNINISKLAYGIFHFSETGEKIQRFPYYGSIKSELKNAYSRIAQIEVKKSSTDGSTKRSSDAIIRKHSVRNSGYLARQLKLLIPDIIFCCGTVTYHSLTLDMKLFTPKNQARGVEVIDGTIIVHYYHPSASQFNIGYIYSEIIEALKRKSR